MRRFRDDGNSVAIAMSQLAGATITSANWPQIWKSEPSVLVRNKRFIICVRSACFGFLLPITYNTQVKSNHVQSRTTWLVARWLLCYMLAWFGFVCVYIFRYVCTHVCIDACLYVHTCLKYVLRYMDMCVYIYIYYSQRQAHATILKYVPLISGQTRVSQDSW